MNDATLGTFSPGDSSSPASSDPQRGSSVRGDFFAEVRDNLDHADLAGQSSRWSASSQKPTSPSSAFSPTQTSNAAAASSEESQYMNGDRPRSAPTSDHAPTSSSVYGAVAPELVPESQRPQPEQAILEWMAPSRPYKKKNRQYYTTIFLIVFLISLILMVLQQFLFIAVVISIGFVAYVFSAVPPGTVRHQLTTYGVRSDSNLYSWDELGRYWYESKYGEEIVHLELGRFPNRVTMLLGELPQAQLDEVLSQILLREKPEPTSFEKAAGWLSRKIPIDLEESAGAGVLR